MTDYKKELQDFAYVVSHDLGAPLRHIRAFGTILIDRLSHKIADEDREYFDYMAQGIDRAEAMLEALLKYSRVDTEGGAFEEFLCEATVRGCAENKEVSASGAQITIKNVPETLVADPRQFKSLVEILLDNAVRFAKDGSAPNIDVSAERDEDGWRFTFADDGVGIDPKYHDIIFQLFRKGPDEADENILGVGLALARRIVRRRGGEIRVESAKDEGARFIFNVPDALPEH